MKKHLFTTVVIGSALAGIISSCSRTNESEQIRAYYRGTFCDTTLVKYSTDIVPILANNCYGCHGANARNGIDVTTIGKLKVYADNGRLIGSVTHAAGYKPMPRNRPKLSTCQVNKISAWVHQGAKNN